MHYIAKSAIFACALTHNAQAQQPWQHLQMPTAAEVVKAWQSPPPEYGPEPYYGLNGPFDLATIQRDLDSMKSLGHRAVTVQFGYGSSYIYLSPEYFKIFRSFVEEAKKRDMRVWIVDDAGYPSGFAGGKFTELKPELRMQALSVTQHVPAITGTPINITLKPETVSVTAINDETDVAISLPFANNAIRWTAPTGKWTVYVVEHIFSTSPTRSDTNPKRVKDGSQSLEDYLDPAATAQYLAFTHEQYKKYVGDEFGKTIMGFRGDEPDYSIRGLPWTPKFFSRFEQTKHYDIRPYVAAFLRGPDAVITPEQLRARADYYDVFADMFRDGFFKPQADWCAANHLEYQVHLNHEEAQLQLAHSEGDFFRDMRYVQVPGIDSIWHQIWTDTISDFPRFASSAAHIYGHPRAFTESFAAYRPEPDVNMVRYILNEQFVRGVNLIETMYYPATSTPNQGGPTAYMRDPAYPKLTDYVRRVSYLLSMGRPAAEIALLLPAESLWMGDAKADNTFVSTERVLSERQLDFDIVDEDAIASLLNMENGAFESFSGNHYRTVLVPRARLLPAVLLKRLQTFSQAGGHVLFIGAAPQFIAETTDLNAKEAKPSDFSWATVIPVELDPVPTPPAQPPTSVPPPLTAPQELVAALATAGPSSALQLQTPDPSLRFLSRHLKDATVFFLFNESNHDINNTVTLNAPGETVEEWDPQTGIATPLSEVNHSNSHTQLPLKLQAYATRIIVIR